MTIVLFVEKVKSEYFGRHIFTAEAVFFLKLLIVRHGRVLVSYIRFF
jgi:hypothetical protein